MTETTASTRYVASYVASNGQPDDDRILRGRRTNERSRTTTGRMRHFPVTVSHKEVA